MLLTLIFRKMSLPISQSMGIDSNLLLYIKENCETNISMSQVAQKCGYNSSYFSRRFSEYIGASFMEYLTDCRIERACKLLAETDLTVEEIVYNCGFTNRTRFFRVFRNKVGITPKKYRHGKK